MSSILLPEFDSIKDNDEEIYWIGRPKFIPYLFSNLGLGLALLLFIIICITTLSNIEENAILPLDPVFYFGCYLPIMFIFFILLIRILAFSNVSYCFSNKRVMIRAGLVGTNFKAIDYDKISEIEVRINFIESLFHVGSIRFFSGQTNTINGNTTNLYDTWIAVDNPYEVFKLVKQISNDVKTDINYPNVLRPKQNLGYNTKYDGID